MKIFKVVLILVGMHLIGSAILVGYASGPSYILAAPIFGVFGWFLILPEAIGMCTIWSLYKPHLKQSWIRTVLFAIAFGILGAAIAAPLIPKEQNHELNYWIGGLVAGSGAAIFSFVCIHRMKMSETAETEPRH